MSSIAPPSPVYEDDRVSLYHGDFRDILPALGVTADLIVTDPPYGETSLDWDRWPEGWPQVAAEHSRSMWMFGSARMFDDWRDDILGPGWRFSQDVIWSKPLAGTGGVTDRFMRSHEHARHYYQGKWSEVHHDQQRIAVGSRPRTVTRAAQGKKWHGERGATVYEDDGTRALLTVLEARAIRGGIHPTEKPTGILEPLIEYGCPHGGLVVDPFTGSGSTLVAARSTGRYAIGFEVREDQCKATARRLAQGDLFGGVA